MLEHANGPTTNYTTVNMDNLAIPHPHHEPSLVTADRVKACPALGI